MGRNFALVAVAQLIAQGLALVVSLTLARLMGPPGYGVYVFAFAFPTWFLLIVDLGLDQVVTIDVAADRSRARDYMSTVAVLRLPLVGATLIALWFAVGFALTDPYARTVTFLIGTSAVIGQFSAMFSGIMRGFERLGYVALVVLIVQILTAVVVLALLLLNFDLIAVGWAYLAISIVGLGLSVALCYLKFAWFAPRVSKDLAKTLLRKTTPFGLAAVMSTFLLSGGPVLLTLLLPFPANTTATGEFNAAYALIGALRTPLGFYWIAVLPTMARFHGEAPEKLGITIQKSQKLFFIAGLPAAFGGFYYRAAIINLFYGARFFVADLSFGIMVFTLAIMTATLGLATALSATNRQKLSLMFGVLGVGLNLGLCFLLIPSLGPTGASIAFLVSTLGMAVASGIAVHRLIAKIDYVDALAKPILAGGAMLGLLFVIDLLTDSPFWFDVLVGAAAYFAVLLLIKGIRRDDWDLLRQVARGLRSRRS